MLKWRFIVWVFLEMKFKNRILWLVVLGEEEKALIREKSIVFLDIQLCNATNIKASFSSSTDEWKEMDG